MVNKLRLSPDERNVPVAVLDEVLYDAARSHGILHQNSVDGGVRDGTVECDNRRFAEESAREAGVPDMGRNHKYAVDVALQHLVGCGVLGFGIFIGGGDDDGIAALLGHGGDRVGATGKEGIVKIRNDQADGMAALAAKCARQHIGTVLELLDCGLNSLGCIGGDANRAAQHAGDGHGADARQPSHVTHGGLAMYNRR